MNADSSNDGDTWNWGYNDASQVSNGVLTISGSRVELIERLSAESYNMDWSDELAGLGFYTELESPEIMKWKHLSLSFTAGYSYAQDDVVNQAIAFSRPAAGHVA